MIKAVYQDPNFKYKLSKCSNLNDTCTLLAENPSYSALLIESCDPAIKLLRETFSVLSLKENQIQTMNTVLDDEVQNLLENVNLDTGLTGKETLEVLKDCPKLKAYLSHCSRAKTYFFH